MDYLKNNCTLINIFPLQEKSMNHTHIFVRKVISINDNKNLTTNRSETKNLVSLTKT